MIAKNVPLEDKVAKSHGARMQNLVQYLENGNEHERVAHVEFFNAMSQDHAIADAEMMALSESNPRAKQPMRHIVLSFQESEIPTVDQAREAARIALQEIGCEHCMAKFSVHHDTDNVHIHIAVCTVDPETQKMVKTAWIEDSLMKAIAKIEHAQGWWPQEKAVYKVMENGDLVKRDQAEKWLADKAAKAASKEVFQGQRSAQDIAAEELAAITRDKRITTWQQFHAKLAEAGMEYQKVGSGARIGVRQDGETVFLKASDLHRNAGLSRLVKRFGEFQESAVKPKERASEAAKAVTGERRELWAEFKRERDAYFTGKRDTWAKLKAGHGADRKALRERHKSERQDLFAGDWKGKLAALNVMRSLMAAKQAAEMASLRDQHAQQRTESKNRQTELFPRDFPDWLAKRGRVDLAQEHRGRSEAEPETNGQEQPAEKKDIRDYQGIPGEHEDRAKNRIWSVVRYMNAHTGDVDFVDFGRRISCLRSDDPAAIRAMVQLSAEKWGHKGFTVKGSDEFKQAMAREAFKLGLADRIKNTDLQPLIQEMKNERDRKRAERQQSIANYQSRAAGAQQGQAARPQNGVRALSERRLATSGQRAASGVVPHHVQSDRRSSGDQLRRNLRWRTDGRDYLSQRQRAWEAYRQAVGADRYAIHAVRFKFHEPDASGKTKSQVSGGMIGPRDGQPADDINWGRIEKMAAQRRADGSLESVYCTAVSASMHHIVVDDVTREKLEALKRDGFRPAFVQETGEGNHQVILNAPKVSDNLAINNEVDRRLTVELNQRYGDAKINSGRHAHRMPGLPNNQPKHILEDGSFRVVNPVEAQGGTCPKAREMAKQHAQAARSDMEEEGNRREARAKAMAEARKAAGVELTDTDQAYFQHYADIAQRMPIDNLSRVDSMIAVRLRVTGHSPEEVKRAIERCAPAIRPANQRQEHRWGGGYAQRTMSYAFGPKGDIQVHRTARYHEQWKRLDHRQKVQTTNLQSVAERHAEATRKDRDQGHEI